MCRFFFPSKCYGPVKTTKLLVKVTQDESLLILACYCNLVSSLGISE